MGDRTDYNRRWYRENKAKTMTFLKPLAPIPEPNPVNIWANQRSLENLLFFFKDELIETMKHKTRPQIPKSGYLNLKKTGHLTYKKQGHDVIYLLSDLCVSILEKHEGKKK